MGYICFHLMPELHKFRPKKFCYVSVITAFCIAITLECEARCADRAEIYSTLTTDTIPLPQNNLPLLRMNRDTSRTARDTTALPDTLPLTSQRVDTFNLRLSKDTLDAPVTYEASDSGVLLVKEKKFFLYGKTKTDYKDVTLQAPRVEFDQASNILTAFNARDSTGNVIARANFKQGTDGFESDTIRYNFKTQRGLTTNTYTKQNELFVQATVLKKIDEKTAFARRVIMTTCEFDDPHFGFIASKGKFITNDIAVTGPIHPEFEGVPVPLYLPFGIFPLKSGAHSGLLPPQFTATEQFGLGLEGLGYYHIINDYLDLTFRTNIYSYGGWSVNVVPSYRKRYRYNGTFNISLQHSKLNFKGDPDYSLTKTFNISWSHNVDQRAKPGTNFSASVNAGSTRFNQFVVNNPNRPFQNQMNSSIAYSKTWQGKPYNLTLSANHSQNNNNHLINLTLPDAGFTVTTLYPFQRSEEKMLGSPRWYEKIGIGYSGVARNQVSFYDVDTLRKSFSGILDTMLWGAQHRFPISMSLPPLGPVVVAPFISYEETWLTRRISRAWNPADRKIDTLYDKKGLFVDRQMSFGISLNTALYGMLVTKKGKLKAIRHVMRPNLNFNYRPNLSSKYYDVIQVDTFGRTQAMPQIEPGRNLFSSYGFGRFGGLTFGIDNNLEMKLKRKSDTTSGGTRFTLIDGFGLTSGYNFLQDSLRLLPFNLYMRTTLFQKVSITAQALYNPYQRDSFGRDINRFVWQGDRFRLGRLRSGSISMSTNFQSKPRDPKKAPNLNATRQITDPNLLADQERMQNYIQRNPAEFVDFNVPWTLNLSFSLFFSDEMQPDRSFKTRVSSNLSFNNSFSLTPKWNFTTNGYYDFETGEITMFTMSINRDMHCWQMSVNVTPIGQTRYFNITISPKSSILQDLRVNRTRYFYGY
jgi:LPS-assembly protein